MRYHIFKATRQYMGRPYCGLFSDSLPAEADTLAEAQKLANDMLERNPVGWDVYDSLNPHEPVHTCGIKQRDISKLLDSFTDGELQGELQDRRAIRRRAEHEKRRRLPGGGIPIGVRPGVEDLGRQTGGGATWRKSKSCHRRPSTSIRVRA